MKVGWMIMLGLICILASLLAHDSNARSLHDEQHVRRQHLWDRYSAGLRESFCSS